MSITKRFIFLKELLFLFILLHSLSVSSQVNTDSILQVMEGIENIQDRLSYLDTICQELNHRKNKDVGPLFEARQQLSTHNADFNTNASRAIEATDYFLRILAAEKAEEIIQPIYEKVDDIEDPVLKIEVLDCRAAIHGDQYQFEPAVEIYQKIIDMYNDGSEPAIEVSGHVYRNLGKNLYGSARYGESSVALNKAKEIFLENNDSTGLKYTFLELGNLFGQIGLFDEAAAYFKERQKYIYPPSAVGSAIDYTNLGRSAILQQRYQKGLDNYYTGLQLGPFADGWDFLDLYFYNGIVECHFFLDKVDSVKYYFQKMDEKYDELDRNVVYEFLYLQSRFLNRLAKKQYELAEADGVILYEKAAKNRDAAELLMYSQFFSELYRRWGKYEKALTYTDEYSELRDSIQSANKNQALLLYQTQYETKEKENKIVQLETENEIQALQARATRNKFLGGGILLLLLAGFVVMRQYFRNKVQRAVQIERLRNKISSDLHDDVGSILTGLAMQTEILEHTLPEENKGRLSRITDMSRSAMSRMRDAVWAMDAQKDNWDSLVDRMNEFASETLTTKDIGFKIQQKGIDGQAKLSGELRQNLYLIFKEALTNILKHSDATATEILLDNTGAAFEMIIKDNGSLKEKNYKTTGQGTKNMRTRAERIDGNLTSNYKDGFVVWLRRPAI